ncbi:MAG: flavodoxin domain-containing protein [Micromonosporaceae bacterium]
MTYLPGGAPDGRGDGPGTGPHPPKILVAASSRHGATKGIAEEIGKVLSAGLPGSQVDVRDPEELNDDGGYCAAVVGSAVYLGHWLEPARHLVEVLGNQPVKVPLWTFSSGPTGDPPRPAEYPNEGAAIAERAGAREHVVFAGKLDKHDLKLSERAVAAMARVPYGDFRNWPKIREWAQHIAAELAAAGSGSHNGPGVP